MNFIYFLRFRSFGVSPPEGASSTTGIHLSQFENHRLKVIVTGCYKWEVNEVSCWLLNTDTLSYIPFVLCDIRWKHICIVIPVGWKGITIYLTAYY